MSQHETQTPVDRLEGAEVHSDGASLSTHFSRRRLRKQLSGSYPSRCTLKSLDRSPVMHLSALEDHEETSALEDHRLWVRFCLEGAEVRRRCVVKLMPGAHLITIEGLSPHAHSMRVSLTRGDEGVIALTSSLEPSAQPLHSSLLSTPPSLFSSSTSPRAITQRDALREYPPTRFDAPPLDDLPPYEMTRSSAEVLLDGADDVPDRERARARYRRVEQSIDRTHALTLSWIGELGRSDQLTASAWREGLDVLEATLQAQVHELERLKREIESPPQHALHASHYEAPPADERDTPSLNAHIQLEVDQAGEYHVEVCYQVHAAAWSPIYQACLSHDQLNLAGTKPRAEVSVHFEMSARFSHATGEQWSDFDAEFSLYPTPRPDFPQLSYPAYERVSLPTLSGERRERLINTLLNQTSASHDQRGEPRDLDWRALLSDPYASLTRLFSDQATMTLTLELELSAPRPRVEVVARGKLDTLLPLAGGQLHRFVGDEWLGTTPLNPTGLGESLFLTFGAFESIVSRVMIQAVTEASHERLAESAHERGAVAGELEEVTLSLHNTSDQVRTLLVWQDLSRGALISTDEHQRSAPVGWVLSADRKRLMRWISLPPQRREHVTLTRRLPAE